MKQIALLPGGFKPPHGGHYSMAKWLAEETKAEVVVVKVGANERDGITREMSIKLWNLYKESDPDSLSKKLLIQPSTSNSPVRDVYDFVEQTAPEGSTVYLGMGEKDMEDDRFKNIGKFAEPRGITFKTTLVPPQAGGISGTEMRNFIKKNKFQDFVNYLPKHLTNEQTNEAWAIVTGNTDYTAPKGGTQSSQFEELYNKAQSGEQPYGDTTRYHDHWKSNDPGPKKPVEPAYQYKRRNFPFRSMYENHTTSAALINNQTVSLETMNTPELQVKGMMGRNSLEGGMLFPYDRVQRRDFHMKNCKISLDIIFINQGKINNIHSDCPPCQQNNCPNYSGVADNVLEFPGGYCKKNNIKIGDKINLNINPTISLPKVNETKYGAHDLISQHKTKIQSDYGHQQYRNLQLMISQQKDEEVSNWLKLKGYINEQNPSVEGRILHVYDFDDTVASIEATIPVELPNGKLLSIPSDIFPDKAVEFDNEYGKGNWTPDFSKFDKQIENAILNTGVVDKLTASLSNPQIKTTILTARTLGHPVTRYLKSVGLETYVVPLGLQKQGTRVMGQDKANWIENHINKGYNTIYFIDDSEENRTAVEALKDKYPTVNLTVENPDSINETRLFSKDWWLNVIKEHLLTEGGAAGHMAHPFNLPNVNSGKDLKDIFVKAFDSLQLNPGSVKLDGVNSSIRLIDLDGQKQFAMDRGSKQALDVKGITKADLEDRFKPGHGMITVGGKVLDMFNEALPSLENDLKKLGAWDDPNILFNMEYVSGKTNVQDYGANFIAIHGLNRVESKEIQGKKGPLIQRASSEIPYDKAALQSMLDNLKPIAEKNNFEVYGSVPTEVKAKPNFGSALSKTYTVKSNKGDKSQSLDKWLSELNDIPEEDFIFMNGKKVGAVSKQVYIALLNGENIDNLFEDEEDKQKAIEGFTTYLATEKLGDEVLKVLDSPMGSVENHEGVVIRDEKIANVPFKITGKFILGGLATGF
jgi:uncharacterized membrane protein (UPF0127 family)